MTSVTVEQVLSNWRFVICFADSVRTESGEYGTVVGQDTGGLIDVVLGKASERSTGRAKLSREKLFPAWWPEAQFHQTSGS